MGPGSAPGRRGPQRRAGGWATGWMALHASGRLHDPSGRMLNSLHKASFLSLTSVSACPLWAPKPGTGQRRDFRGSRWSSVCGHETHIRTWRGPKPKTTLRCPQAVRGTSLLRAQQCASSGASPTLLIHKGLIAGYGYPSSPPDPETLEMGGCQDILEEGLGRP